MGHAGAMAIRTSPLSRQAQRMLIVEAVESAAAGQFGVISRAQALELGADKDRIRCEVRCARWAVRGRHTVSIHRGSLRCRRGGDKP